MPAGIGLQRGNLCALPDQRPRPLRRDVYQPEDRPCQLRELRRGLHGRRVHKRKLRLWNGGHSVRRTMHGQGYRPAELRRMWCRVQGCRELRLWQLQVRRASDTLHQWDRPDWVL